MSKPEIPRVAFFIDTNVLLHDRECLSKFGYNIVVIPIWALEELDKFKKHQDELGANAREISRQLEKLREHGSLAKGAPTETGGLLFVDYNGTDFNKLPVGLLRNNDNRIILVAKAWQEKLDKLKKGAKQKEPRPKYSEVIIVSKDINLRLKADACGITAQDYLGDKTIERIEMLYSGMETHVLPNRMKFVLNDHTVRQQGLIPAKALADTLRLDDIHANACCQFRVDKTTVNAIYKKATRCFRIERKMGPARKCLVMPSNIEQRFAYELLMDPEISIVTLNGKAGSGKTLMALLAGYEQLEDAYDQLLVYRPCHEIGAPLGFRPGSTEEKFDPFTLPIFDNMKLLLDARESLCATGQQGGRYVSKGFKELREPKESKNGSYAKVKDLIAKGLLDIGPINHIRGRSIARSFIIVDEAQNLTPLEVKTIISRAGEGTKVVLTGDVYQIDNPLVDSISNGLSHTVERLKGSGLAGHITLLKCERSNLAELAATLL